MKPELSIPVIWAEDGGSQTAGRLDVHRDRLLFDGGVRGAPLVRDLAYTEIASARMGRENGDRINGRPAIVLALKTGGRLSFVGFDRPGTLAELLQRIEERVSASRARAPGSHSRARATRA